MTAPILETRSLTYRYPGGTRALDAVDLRFRRGSRNAVLGANGAGKSTLFLLLNGVLRPAAGQVLLDGQPLDYGREGMKLARSRIGVLFQDPDAQLVSASIREDVSFGPMNLGLDPATVRERVAEALAATRLEALADRPVHALSYGQKRRVGIAGLLAMHPEVLVLDEPSAGLDPRSCLDFFAMLDGLCGQGLTVVLSTHAMDLAYAWADHAFLLDQGRLVADCPSAEFARALPGWSRYGFERPRVLAIHQALVARGLLADGPPPRDQAQLLAAIGAGRP